MEASVEAFVEVTSTEAFVDFTCIEAVVEAFIGSFQTGVNLLPRKLLRKLSRKLPVQWKLLVSPIFRGSKFKPPETFTESLAEPNPNR